MFNSWTNLEFKIIILIKKGNPTNKILYLCSFKVKN